MYPGVFYLLITVLLTVLLGAVLALWLVRNQAEVRTEVRALHTVITSLKTNLGVPPGPERWGGPVGDASAGREPRALTEETFPPCPRGDAMEGARTGAATVAASAVPVRLSGAKGGVGGRGGGPPPPGAGGAPPPPQSSLRDDTDGTRTDTPGNVVEGLRRTDVGEPHGRVEMSLNPSVPTLGAGTGVSSVPRAPDRGPSAGPSGDAGSGLTRHFPHGGGSGGGVVPPAGAHSRAGTGVPGWRVSGDLSLLQVLLQVLLRLRTRRPARRKKPPLSGGAGACSAACPAVRRT